MNIKKMFGFSDKSKDMLIRTATIKDLDAITAMEQVCFPAEEAASRASFQRRLQAFPDHFWILELDGEMASIINGCVTDEKDLTDEMYDNETMHTEQGEWQMIFGVLTDPAYQGRGYASTLMKYVILQCKIQKRKGIVLTCKDALVPFYEQFGYQNEGPSESEHGGASWNQMRLTF